MSLKTTQYRIRKSPEGYQLLDRNGAVAAICSTEATAKEFANVNIPLIILREISETFHRIGMNKDATVIDFLIDTIEKYTTEKEDSSSTLRQWLSLFTGGKK